MADPLATPFLSEFGYRFVKTSLAAGRFAYGGGIGIEGVAIAPPTSVTAKIATSTIIREIRFI